MANLDSTQYSYMLISIQTPTPVRLVHITCKQDTHMACYSQIYRELVDGTASRATWGKAVRTHLGKDPLLAGPADTKFLVRLGATVPQNRFESLITWSLVCKALKTCKVASSIVNAVAAVQHAHGDVTQLTVLPLPEGILQACSQPSTNPEQLQMLGPLPDTFPSSQTSNQPTGKRYGLKTKWKHLHRMQPLPLQYKELHDWATPDFQFSRNAFGHKPRTWQNTCKYIDLFLGYCRFKGVQQPTLQAFLSPDLICQYVSFKVGAQHSINTIGQFLATAREVLKWWQTKPGGKHPSLEEAVQWLYIMGKQVSTCSSPVIVLPAFAWAVETFMPTSPATVGLLTFPCIAQQQFLLIC